MLIGYARVSTKILESAEEIYGIAFINLPEFSPEER
jgi:hypothetical protein